MKNLLLISTLALMTLFSNSFASCSYGSLDNETIAERIEVFMLNKLNVEALDIKEIYTLKEGFFAPLKMKAISTALAPFMLISPAKAMQETCSKYMGLYSKDVVTYLQDDKVCQVILYTKLKSSILGSGVSSVVKQKLKPVCSQI